MPLENLNYFSSCKQNLKSNINMQNHLFQEEDRQRCIVTFVNWMTRLNKNPSINSNQNNLQSNEKEICCKTPVT